MVTVTQPPGKGYGATYNHVPPPATTGYISVGCVANTCSETELEAISGNYRLISGTTQNESYVYSTDTSTSTPIYKPAFLRTFKGSQGVAREQFLYAMPVDCVTYNSFKLYKLLKGVLRPGTLTTAGEKERAMKEQFPCKKNCWVFSARKPIPAAPDSDCDRIEHWGYYNYNKMGSESSSPSNFEPP